MKKVLFPIVGMTAFLSSQANADISPRVEVKAGYDEVTALVRYEDSALTDKAKEDAIAVGLEAGVDFDVNENILVGAYAGYEFPGIKGCGELFGDDEFCVRNKSSANVGLRAGLRIEDGGLIYAKGGLSTTKVKASYDDGFGLVFEDSDRTSGWHVGAGFEIKVSGGVYVKAEYVHTRYKNVFKDSLASTDSVNPSRNQLLGGIGYRF